MSLTSRERRISDAYAFAKEQPQDTLAYRCAVAADGATGDALETIKDVYSLKVNGTDPCMSLELKMFTFILESNGVCIGTILAQMDRETSEGAL